MLNPDAWYRKQVRQLLWQGPGAVSAFWSMPMVLVGAALSLAGNTGPAWLGLCMLLANVSLGALLILIDDENSFHVTPRFPVRFDRPAFLIYSRPVP